MYCSFACTWANISFGLTTETKNLRKTKKLLKSKKEMQKPENIWQQQCLLYTGATFSDVTVADGCG